MAVRTSRKVKSAVVRTSTRPKSAVVRTSKKPKSETVLMAKVPKVKFSSLKNKQKISEDAKVKMPSGVPKKAKGLKPSKKRNIERPSKKGQKTQKTELIPTPGRKLFRTVNLPKSSDSRAKRKGK
jgi:hypothetical protein